MATQDESFDRPVLLKNKTPASLPGFHFSELA
jgi:hypothetical protein